MISNESKNAMEVMVLNDLAAICRKLAEDSATPEALRGKAQEFVEEFNALLPARDTGTAAMHFGGEQLLTKIARFLPRVLEDQAEPAVPRKD
jgi:hypothetical protein